MSRSTMTDPWWTDTGTPCYNDPEGYTTVGDQRSGEAKRAAALRAWRCKHECPVFRDCYDDLMRQGGPRAQSGVIWAGFVIPTKQMQNRGRGD